MVSAEPPAHAYGISLRPYQVEQIAAVLSRLDRERSTLVSAATGTGKTIGIAELTRLFRARGVRVLIVVNRDELVRQTVRKCESLGISPDVEKGSRRASTMAKVVVASVQTLKGARLARWARDHFGLVIVDECHHAAAKSYRALIAHFVDAKVVGFTATAVRADGQPLIDAELFASMAHDYGIRTAIRDGNLVPIVARRIVVDGLDLDKVDETRGDFKVDALSGAMRDARTLRGQVVPLLELAHDRQTVAFCVDVQHAHDVAALLNDLRPGCARAVSGETDDDEREELLRAHAAGEFQFLTNCDLLVEGYDAPSISCVAMLRPTRSWGRFVQCVGRGLRLLGLTYAESCAAGKRDCLVLITDDGKTPGLQGPADVLLGFGAVPDDLRAEIDRLIGTAAKPIAEVIDDAASEVEQRRAQKTAAEVLRWHAEVIDPFVGVDPGPRAGQYGAPSWKNEPASVAQLEALAKAGVNTDKLATGKVRLSRAQAWDLLSRLVSRKQRGLCTLAQAKRLRGFVDTVELTFADASRLMAAGARHGWPDGVRLELAAMRDERSEAA